MKKIFSIKDIKLIDWTILGVIISFISFTMIYTDIMITYSHGLYFLDCLFENDLKNFYVNSNVDAFLDAPAMYYLPIYFIFGLWELPIWIINRIGSINIYSLGCLIWMKLLLLLFVVGIIKCMMDILKESEVVEPRRKASIFILLSSMNLIIPVFSLSQYDIILCFFILLGLREYIKSPKISWKFLAIFLFASTLKLFALFILIPLILLKEKRICYIIIDIIISCGGVILSILLYRDVFLGESVQSSFNRMWVEDLLATTFTCGDTEVPIFVCIYIGICIFAYVKIAAEKDEIVKLSVWLSVAVLVDFFSFVLFNPYWIVLITPFLALLIQNNQGLYKTNLILDFFLNVGITVYHCYRWPYLYGYTGCFEYMILPQIGLNYNDDGYIMIKDIIEAHGWDIYMNTFFGIFVVSGIALLILNYPQKKMEKECDKENIEKGLLYLRVVLPVGYVLGTLLIAYIR